MKTDRNFWISLALPLGWYLLLLVLNNYSISSGKTTQIALDSVQMGGYNTEIRKFAHVLYYGFEGILVYLFIQKLAKPFYKVLICSLLTIGLLGFIDETIQYFLPDRHARGTDILLDVLGALLFITFYEFIFIKYFLHKVLSKTK